MILLISWRCCKSMHGITIRAKIITLALSVIYGLLPVLLHAADNPLR